MEMDDINKLLINQPLIFIDKNYFTRFLSGGESLQLSPEDLRHYRKVLRLTNDFHVTISNGEGLIAVAVVNGQNRLTLLDKELYYFSRSRKTRLIMPFIKKKGLEIMIQKLTETGVDEIEFIQSDHQVLEYEKLDRLIYIAQNACAQSKNPVIPAIKISKFSLLDYPFDQNSTYIWGDYLSKGYFESIHIDKESSKDLVFINGPEGGWSSSEKMFLENKFLAVTLSQNILKAETAAVCAIYELKKYSNSLIVRKR